MADEPDAFFHGDSGKIEKELRKLLAQRDSSEIKLDRQVLTLRIRELKEKLVSAKSDALTDIQNLSAAESDESLFEGDIGDIETRLRHAVHRRSSTSSHSELHSAKTEIKSLTDLLRSPLIREDRKIGAEMKRAAKLVLAQNVEGVKQIDAVILRAIRDPATGQGILHKAALVNSVDVINVLVLEKGCDVNTVSNFGQTPLHIALQLENIEVARRLVELESDLSIQDKLGRTPLTVSPRLLVDECLAPPPVDPTTDSPQWELNPYLLQYGSVIGEGSTATVYAGKYNGGVVAIKHYTAVERTDFNRELHILTKLRHPNLLLFVGATTRGKLQLITELCEGGSLYHFLHEDKQKLSNEQIVAVCRDTLAGLEYLHGSRPRIVHLDVKSRNLLFMQKVGPSSSVQVKIADFGISRISSVTTGAILAPASSMAGTWFWMSPEALLGDLDAISDKSDIYSFSVCLYEMLTGELPYASIDGLSMLPPVAVAIKVSTGLRPDVHRIDPSTKEELKELVEMMQEAWVYEPTDRPTASQLLTRITAAYPERVG